MDSADAAPKRKNRPRRTRTEIEAAAAIEALRVKRPRRTKAQMEAAKAQAEQTANPIGTPTTPVDVEGAVPRRRPRTKQEIEQAKAQAVEIRRAVIQGSMTSEDGYAAMKKLGGRLPLIPRGSGSQVQNKYSEVKSEPEYEEHVETPPVAPRKRPHRPRLNLEGLPERQQEVLKYLHKIYGWSNRRNAVCDVRRVNIVSVDLCDAILERMKPSLERHKGCDIIDVNPGAGIWSSKLHDHLKPRSHILMEPDSSYEATLQQFLDEPNSKFKLYPKSGIVWGHLETGISKQFLPHQNKLPTGDPRLEQPNDTILFVANLAYHPKKIYRSFGSLTHLVLHQLMSAIRSHSLFQRYGQIRMLIWLVDAERYYPLPRHIATRKKSSIEVEMSCGNITEIASSTRPVGLFRRDEGLEADRTAEVIQTMKEQRISTPENRESFMQRHLNSLRHRSEFSIETADKDRIGNLYLKQLRIMEKRFERGDLKKYRDEGRTRLETSNTGILGNSPEPVFELSPEYKKLLTLRSRKVMSIKSRNTVLEFAALQDEIMDLQRELYNGDPNEPTYESRRAHLTQLMQHFKDSLGRIKNEVTATEVTTYLDEKRLMQQPVPGLAYDRRSVEPLMTRPDDFFPEHELALVDFQPQSIWPILRDNFPANYDEFEYIISNLFGSSSIPVPSAIKSLWPGAADWMLPRCPTLANPNMGGDMDISRVSVRCLSMKMMEEIFEAWMSWPFKPSRMELIGRLNDYASEDVEVELAGDGEHA